MIRLEKIDKYFGGQRVLNSVDLQLGTCPYFCGRGG
jgi:cystine transport system ATP-binding protein